MNYLLFILMFTLPASVAIADTITVQESKTPLTCNPGCEYQKSNYVKDVASSKASEYDPIPPGDGHPDFPLPDPYPIPPMTTCTFFTEYGELEMCSAPPGKFCSPTMRMVAQTRRYWGVTSDSTYTCSADKFKPFAKYKDITLPRFSDDNLVPWLCPPDENCKPAPVLTNWFTSNVTDMVLLIGPTFLKVQKYNKQFYLVGKMPSVSNETTHLLRVKAINSQGSVEMDATLVITPK